MIPASSTPTWLKRKASASAWFTDFPCPQDTPWITTEALMERNFNQPVDVIVCGDTHVAHIERTESGVLIVNPGSPALPRNIREPGHVGHPDYRRRAGSGGDSEPDQPGVLGVA